MSTPATTNTVITGFAFGQGHDFALVPPALAYQIDLVLLRQQILRRAIQMACDCAENCLGCWDIVFDARDKLIFEGGSLWSWFSRNPARRHYAYHHAGHVLFWGWESRYYTIVNEAGERPCGCCLGVGRYWDGPGKVAIQCPPCNGTGVIEVIAWVPAALAAKGVTS